MFERTDTLIDMCVRVYDAMAESATPMTTNPTNLLWTGKTTHLFNTLTVPVSYYARVMRTLVGLGSLEQVQRGTAAQPSIWLLLGHPAAQEWKKNLHSEPLTPPGADDSLTELSKRVAAIEQRLGTLNVPIAIRDIVLELQTIKTQLLDIYSKLASSNNQVNTQGE